MDRFLKMSRLLGRAIDPNLKAIFLRYLRRFFRLLYLFIHSKSGFGQVNNATPVSVDHYSVSVPARFRRCQQLSFRQPFPEGVGFDGEWGTLTLGQLLNFSKRCIGVEVNMWIIHPADAISHRLIFSRLATTSLAPAPVGAEFGLHVRVIISKVSPPAGDCSHEKQYKHPHHIL